MAPATYSTLTTLIAPAKKAGAGTSPKYSAKFITNHAHPVISTMPTGTCPGRTIRAPTFNYPTFISK